MDAAFPPLAKVAGPGTLVLSIAAGRTIASFEKHLAPGAAVVRAMPNTPAAVGRGITVCVANPAVTPEQRRLCEELMSAVGDVAWVEDEGLMDAVTAVSGSGPAYVFLLAECLEKAGRAAGLDRGPCAAPRHCDGLGRGRALAPVRRRSKRAPGKRDVAWRNDGGGALYPDGRRAASRSCSRRPWRRGGPQPRAGEVIIELRANPRPRFPFGLDEPEGSGDQAQ